VLILRRIHLLVLSLCVGGRPEDEQHSCSKHVEDSNKRIIEEIVRQVGYVPDLYEDARSEKYQMLCRITQINHPTRCNNQS